MATAPSSYYQQVARQAATRFGVPVSMFLAQIQQESGWNPNARSPAGATGIAQIMPGTARGWGVNPTDPVASLNAAARAMGKYLRSYGGDPRKALAAYNAGPGAVAKYGGVPPYRETQNYVQRILAASGGAASEPAPAGVPAPAGAADTGYADTPRYNIRQLLPALTAASSQATAGRLDKVGLLRALAAARLAPQAQGATAAPTMGLPAMGAPPVAVPTGAASGFAAAPDYRWADTLAKQFGLRVSSTKRDPAAQARIYGGSGKRAQYTSRHLTQGGAADISGSPAAMRRLAEWAIKSGLFAEVFYDPIGQWDNGRFSRKGIGGHSDHVHLSFGTGALQRFYGGRR